ncbi:MAG: undecaprenyl diphosphate synthase family protein [Candidatus Woesearchaeota archaeon]
MLERFRIFKPAIPREKKENTKHLAVSLASTGFLKEKEKASESFRKREHFIKELIDYQLRKNITILTIYILRKKPTDISDEEKIIRHENVEAIARLFENLSSDKMITENNIRIFVLGKWYDLSGKTVNSIKDSLEKTEDYDRHFLNFCINYDGNDEITDSAKILARKVKFEKINVDDITSESIKENLYSSYFIPPEKMIIASREQKIDSFLLWDTAHAEIIFLDRNWDEISIRDIEKID